MVKRFLITAALMTLIVGMASLSAWAIPQVLNFEGQLTDLDGSALNGAYEATFYLYHTETGGEPVWSEQQTVTVNDGIFNILLGSVVPLSQDLFDNNQELYLELAIYKPELGTYEVLSPRQRFASTAFALKAQDADTLDGKHASEFLSSSIDVQTKEGGLNVTGNVGIGTTSPSEKLSVAGTVESTSGGFKFPDGTVQTTAAGAAGSGSGDGYSLNAADGDPVDALYVDNEGRVGIGTTSPGARLEVNGQLRLTGNSFSTISNFPGVGRELLALQAKSDAVDGEGSLHDGSGMALYGNGDSIAPGQIRLHAGGVTRLTVLPNGNVGIGTTSPEMNLEISGANIYPGYSIVKGNSWYDVIVDDDTGPVIAFDESDKLRIGKRTNYPLGLFTELLTISNSGNVGIGTTSPSERLDVAGAVKATAFNLNGSTITSWPSGAGTGDGHSLDAADGSLVDAVYVDNAGNVGIGTTSPQGLLTVYSTSNTDDQSDGITLHSASGNINSYIYHNTGGDLIIRKAANSDQLVLDNNGNVGIGTTNPTALLEVRKNQDSGTFFKLANRDVGASAFTQLGLSNGTDYTAISLMGTGAGRVALFWNNAPNGIYFDQMAGSGDFVFRTGTGYSEKVRITNNGNVGIGTTSPTQSLEVNGKIKAGGFYIGSIPIISGWDGPLQVIASNNAGDQVAMKNTNSAKIASMGAINNADVRAWFGIGGSSRSGDENVAFFMTNKHDFTDPGGMRIGHEANSAYIDFLQSDYTVMRIDSSGNVGIGTTSPSERLEVAGAVKATSFIGDGSQLTGISGSGQWTNTTGGIYYNSGNIGIGTTSPSQNLHIGGPNDHHLQIDSTSHTRCIRIGTNQGGFAAYLQVSQDTTNSLKTWDIGVWPDNEGRFGIGHPGEIGKLNILPNGNVGIGTTSPGSKLEISGNVDADSFSINGVPIGTSSDSYWSETSGNIYYNGGNIGIGTTSPTELLHLASSSNLGTALRLENTGTGGNNWRILSTGTGNTGGAGNLVFYNDTTAAFGPTITNIGNVGIGTTSPGSKLEIIGANTQQTLGSAALRVGGNNTYQIIEMGVHYDYGNAGSNSWIQSSLNGTSVKLLLNPNGGNIGIGMTSPSERLEVAGTVKATAFNLNGNTITSWPSGAGTGDGHSLDAADGSPVDAVYVDNAGNVGIGTMSPGSKLEIVNSDSTSSEIVSKFVGNHDSYNHFIFQSNSPTGAAIIQVRGREEGSDTLYTNFQVASDGSYAAILGNASKFYIDSGNVGIGTTEPLAALHIRTISNDYNNGLVIENAGSSGYQNSIWFLNINGGGSTLANPSAKIAIGAPSYNNSTMSLQVNNGGSLTTGIFIKQDGNVGIGTTNPSERLEVVGTVKATVFVGDGSGLTNIVGTADSDWTESEGNVYRESGNVGIGTMNPGEKLEVQSGPAFCIAALGNENSRLHLVGYEDSFHIVGRTAANDMYKSVMIRASGVLTEGLFVDSNGNVGICTTSPTERLQVAGNGLANNWLTSSDSRLKKNVATIAQPLEKVASLRGVEFEWRTEEYPEKGLDEGRKIGLIAQEVEEVLPEVVSTDEQGYKAVEYGNIVGVLVEAIKAQQNQIKVQQAQIEELQRRIGELENR